MTLSFRTDFALRALMYLARTQEEKPNRRVPSAEIASAFDIPPNHLMKVINELARAGYVRTARGPGGGVELVRPPHEIRLGALIERLQGPLRLHDCVGSRGVCAIESFCKLRGIFRRADQVQRDFLNGFTLADIAPAPEAVLDYAI